MNASIAPTVSFPVETPASTLALNASQSGWANDTTYVARYDVTDANMAIANIDVQTAGAKDLAGNLQLPGDAADRFSIAMRNPSVTNIASNTALITDANAGTAAFALTVTYDEPMDVSLAPNISFPVENPSGSLTLNVARAAGLTTEPTRPSMTSPTPT